MSDPGTDAQPRFTVIVPARRAAQRLPDKPLADLEGQPMVVRVAERALQSGAQHVLVATDDSEIVAACRAAGIEAILTRADHASGTDRLAEAAAWLELADDSVVVNVQGDEPLMPPGLIARAAAELGRAPDCAIATACHAIDKEADFTDPNVVKVVFDAERRALYFSRAPIPWERGRAPGALPQHAFRHIGIYAYRAGFLMRFPQLEPAPLEALEKLEQLRALWHGYRIAVFETGEAPEAGVDTAADLERVRAVMAARRALVTAAR